MDNSNIQQQLNKNLIKESIKEFIDATRQTIETKILDILTILQSMKEDSEQNILKCKQ